ncbi:MAG: PHP domain-containing protein [Taibaiella sp.]|nr:PHP domain-containing protein [Taibaiella sp.]
MLLNVHSHYSLRYGTIKPDVLADQLLAHGYETVVLTDINNSTGVLDFIRIGWEKGIRPLAGMEFRDGDRMLYIGIAKNENGFQELNELMTAVHKGDVKLPGDAPGFRDVFVVYPFREGKRRALRDNEFVGIRPSELSRTIMGDPVLKEKYVILSPVSFSGADYTLHRQLRAIDNNILISQLQPHQVAGKEEILVPRTKLLQMYSDFPELIRNTSRLLSQCSFDFDFKKAKNKALFTDSPYADKELLYQYTMEGFSKRYGKNNRQALERVAKELEIISSRNFSSYFLVTDDICRYARSRNYHYVGRGSGANSIVAYCLGITEVCPVELDLYFERFLNPKRTSSPDFDIDFCWNERDDIYRYIFQTYGSRNTALLGAMSTFQERNTVRELGKIFGLPKTDIDRMVQEPEHMLNKNEVTHMILSVCDRLKDFSQPADHSRQRSPDQ